MGPYFLIYDTVGLYPLIYLQSKYHPRHILYIYCPASVPPLFAQWAYTSSFYDTVGLYSIYLPSGHHPRCIASFPPLLHQWAYTPSFQKKDHRWREECTAGLGAHCNNKSANYFKMKSWFPIKTKKTTLSRNTHLVLLLFTQWAHTSSFYDTVGLYPPHLLSQ